MTRVGVASKHGSHSPHRVGYDRKKKAIKSSNALDKAVVLRHLYRHHGNPTPLRDVSQFPSFELARNFGVQALALSRNEFLQL